LGQTAQATLVVIITTIMGVLNTMVQSDCIFFPSPLLWNEDQGFSSIFVILKIWQFFPKKIQSCKISPFFLGQKQQNC
jgi:hypothetical protein